MLFSFTLSFQRSRFVEVRSTDGSVCQHGDHARLYLKDTAGQVDELFFTVLFNNTHHARLDGSQQRRMARENPQFAFATCHLDLLHQAGKHMFFRADYIQMVSHSHITLLSRRYSFLAFSTASSMAPTM
ncbi:hypothetical protein D3C73_1034100 [compost metagenome]